MEGEERLIAGDRILQAPEGAGEDEAVEAFSYFDAHEPEVTCEHFFAEAYNTGALDWVHANSLMTDASEDAWFVMSKNMDALHKVDRATGEVLWQMGGADSDFTFEGQGGWSHAHMSQIWDGGMMVFDNGSCRGHSIVREIDPVGGDAIPAAAGRTVE